MRRPRRPQRLVQCAHANVARLNELRVVQASAENILRERRLGTPRRKRTNRAIPSTDRLDAIAVLMLTCSQRRRLRLRLYLLALQIFHSLKASVMELPFD